MNEELDGQPLDPASMKVAAEFHQPPLDIPREAMWDRLQIERRRRQSRARRFRGLMPTLPMAAVLLLGIALGWMLRPAATDAPATVASAPADAVQDTSIFRAAATRHLEQAERFLVLFRDAVGANGDASLAPGGARQLLVSNRLLLASPAADDDSLRALLQDVEFILVQITQLPAEVGPADPTLITDGLTAGNILPRLRRVVNTRSPAAVPQGAL